MKMPNFGYTVTFLVSWVPNDEQKTQKFKQNLKKFPQFAVGQKKALGTSRSPHSQLYLFYFSQLFDEDKAKILQQGTRVCQHNFACFFPHIILYLYFTALRLHLSYQGLTYGLQELTQKMQSCRRGMEVKKEADSDRIRSKTE